MTQRKIERGARVEHTYTDAERVQCSSVGTVIGTSANGFPIVQFDDGPAASIPRDQLTRLD